MGDARLRTLGAAALMLVLAACGGGTLDGPVAGFSAEDGDGLNGAVLTEPYLLPDAVLTGSSGAAYDLRGATTDPLTLVFFGYTRCPDICLAVMADIASALTRLSDEEAAEVGMLFVTTDPQRDDPAALRAYLDRFDPAFEGVTAPLPKILELAESLHVAVEQGERLPSGGYEVSHGTAILGVLPDGSVPVVWTESTGAGPLAEDIHRILEDGIPSQKKDGR